MNTSPFFTFEKITASDPRLPSLIILSMGSPTPEKVQKVLGLYETTDHYLMGSVEDNKLLGMIGLKIQGTQGIIRHIAIVEEYQLKGMGKALIKQSLDYFHLKALQAETDQDSVDFYRKFGFICQSFEGHYGKRYTCKYKT